MNAQQFLLIVWARRRIVLAIFALTVVATTVVSLLLPKLYVASVSIVVDVKPDPIAGTVLPGVASPTYMATQTEIIQSERVATRVVKMLKLETSAAAVETWRDSTDGKVPFENFYGGLLLRSLQVKPARGSSIINVVFNGRDPAFTASVANAFAQAYIDTSIDLRVEPARQYAAWFDERMKSLRGTLEKSQAKLSAYQLEKGIVATDARLDEEIARLNALTSQLSGVLAQKVESNTRIKTTGSEYSPDVMQNPLILGIKSSLAQAEAKLTEISSVVGANHPQRKALEAQIDGQKKQLQSEIRRISGGAASVGRATAQLENELKGLIEAQKKRVFDLRAEHDEIAVLVQEVESAQRAYEAVAKRVTELSLESKSEQTNLSVLSPAITPHDPARPKVMVNILASLAGGLLLGILVAVGVESLDRRVRNADDLKAIDGIPVLGALQEVSRPLSPRERAVLLWRFLRHWRRTAEPLGAN